MSRHYDVIVGMSSKKDAVFMGTTEVSAERSPGEITSLLVRSGAKQIATDYQGGRISGLRFVLNVAGQDLAFELPARTDPLLKRLLKRRPYTFRSRGTPQEYERSLREEAERIGWRQLFRWVQAQLAMIEVGMVSAHEVFFPYLIVGANRTALRAFEQDTLKMLPAPELPR